MEIIYLQAVLMDNGEIICDGKTIGWESKVGKYIYTQRNIIKETKEVVIRQIDIKE